MRDNSLKDLKILFVEDEKNLADLLKQSIGDNFYSFSIAHNGKDGIDKFRKILPDIVISDIMIPELNGLEMAKEIKKIEPSTPIIILSAFSETDKLLNAIDVGVVKYFIKPFDPDELLDYISTLSKKINSKPILLHDGFIFNKTKRSLYKDDKYIPLSKREVTFMLLLVKNLLGVTDLQTIKTELWKDEEDSSVRLRSFIKRFRIKTSKELLLNVKGKGYQLVLA
ncbi:MAG: response regulator transcription factor [Arcobacteraceae bacterium]|nr:response regulator transcription factor [Arcobacteraceae bacterium]